MGTSILEALCSGVLGITFLVAALPKLRHPRGFMVSVLAYDVLPSSWGLVYARLTPSLELLGALLLLSGIGVRLAAMLLLSLLLSFIVGVGSNIARGRDLECFCFGRTRRRIGPGVLVQDSALLVVATILLFLANGWTTLAPWSVLRLGERIAVFGWPTEVAGYETLSFIVGFALCIVCTLGVAVALSAHANASAKFRMGEGGRVAHR